ncbi:hypothetical protein M2306_000479 [Myroides gitamensis]|nr:hypothetical protein [Myroides gitamensis]
MPLQFFFIISPPYHLSHWIIFVFVFDESSLRSDFTISPPHLTIYLIGLYLFSYSMNLHYVPISPPHHLTTSSPHHLITSPPHHLTISPSHHLTTSSPHHLITSPPHHLTTSSPHHLITSPPHHLTTSPSHHLTTSSPHHLIGLYLFSYSMNLHYVPISSPHQSTLRFDFISPFFFSQTSIPLLFLCPLFPLINRTSYQKRDPKRYCLHQSLILRFYNDVNGDYAKVVS